MANLLSPSYQDYLSRYRSGDQSAFSESGASNLPDQLSEDQWNKLSDAEKFQAMGGLGAGKMSQMGFSINASDPRYAALAGAFTKPGQNDNNPSLTFGYDPNFHATSFQFQDPSLVQQQGGIYGYSTANETPAYKNWLESQRGLHGTDALFVFGPILGAAAYALAAGAGAAGGAADAGAAGGAFDGATAAAEGGTGAGAFGGATAGAEGSSGLLGGAFNGATAGAEGGTGVSGLLGQAGSWAMAHPLQAAGLAQTAYGLLGGGRSSAPSSGGSSKGGGGGSLGTQGIQQKFYVNPVTQAQLQRYQGGLL